MNRIVEVFHLAQTKLDLVKSQCHDLSEKIQQAKEDSVTNQLSLVQLDPSPFPSSSFIKMVDVKPDTDQPESSRTQNTTPTWEQWCNARYTSAKKAAMDIDGQGQTSLKQGEAAPVSNVDCKEKIEIETMIQGWHAWAKTQKMIFKDKVSWSDLALRITWGFRGNLHFWWERISDNSKLRIIQHPKPLDELVKAVVHEFYGDIRINSAHYADTFMSQKLCDLSHLKDYYCMMQGLLYKVPDPRNTAYLRKYVSSMPNPVPELVNKRLENEDIDMETLSLAGLHEQVVTAIQEECVRKKVAKSLKKQLNLSSQSCEIFKETSSYGCFKPKPKPKSTKSSSCTCHSSSKGSKPTKFKKLKGLNQKENSSLKRDVLLQNLGILLALSARSLATGHLSVLCGLKLKPKSRL
jgi:hypothetical protein